MKLSRTAAFVFVAILSVIVLGSVWGAAILLLPQHDYDAVSLAQSMPDRLHVPDPVPLSVVPEAPADDLSLTTLPPPDPLPAPPLLDRSAGSPASMPLNMEIRCDDEMESACPEGSVEERGRCMQAKWRRLSAPCRQRAREQLARMKTSLYHMKVACEGDVRRLCQDIEPGGGAILQCLEAHAQEVSDPCFQALPKKGRLLR